MIDNLSKESSPSERSGDIPVRNPAAAGMSEQLGQFSSNAASASASRGRTSFRLKAFILSTAILTLCFARPLLDLVRYTAKSELYSYILLIPFIVAYLIRIKLPALRGTLTGSSAARWAFIPFLAGILVFAGCRFAIARGWFPAPTDYLCPMMLSFLFCLLGLCFAFFSIQCLRTLAFPIAFAFFSVPFPETLQRGIESFLQFGSADVAAAMLSLSGMPLFRDGTSFQLPGFSLRVAPECSGIHSTIILAITSLLAAYLFLRSNWRRSALTLAVIPLALLRNGFRIFTIAQLCVRLGPDMINSPIHRRGGPIFFALSLVPLLLLLVFLRKGERKKPQTQAPHE